MEQDLVQIFELFLALAAAVVAFWQHRQKLVAVDAKDEALVERDLAEARQWETEALKDNVISFFDPEDESVVKAPPEVAARSWKMTDETKKWVICGHSPEDQASLLKQIADAEGQKKIQYLISVPGCYYEIEYGLLKGGGKGG